MLLNEGIEENPEDYPKYIFIYAQAAILYSMVWGIGGLLNSASREKFDVFLRDVR